MRLVYVLLLSLFLISCKGMQVQKGDSNQSSKSTTGGTVGSTTGATSGGTTGATVGGTTGTVGATTGGTTGATTGGTTGTTGGTTGSTTGGTTSGTTGTEPTADWYVQPGGSGSGTSSSPFGKIQDALQAAQPGDVILVRNGTYSETLTSVRNGTNVAPITILSANPRGAIVTKSGRVLTISHSYLEFKDLVFDGQYGAQDAVKVTSAGDFLKLTGIEVRKASRDCIDIDAPQDVVIDGALVHHCLWWNVTERDDAHAIVSGAAIQNLKILNTEAHTFSGDAFQVDPSRSAPGWNNVLIENCHFWLRPLDVATNGFPAGKAPGENAIDTKTVAGFQSNITIRNTIASGFRNGFLTNMAAFNMKENVKAVLDRVTVFDNEIAFRLRGPVADVQVSNSVIYNNKVAVRYEDNIKNLKLYHNTFGAGNESFFVIASAPTATLIVKNNIFAATALPTQAPTASNRATTSPFVNMTANDYHLTSQQAASETIPGITVDRDGKTRVVPSFGAFEF